MATTQVPSKRARIYLLDDVKRHNKAGDCFVVHDNKVYDVSRRRRRSGQETRVFAIFSGGARSRPPGRDRTIRVWGQRLDKGRGEVQETTRVRALERRRWRVEEFTLGGWRTIGNKLSRAMDFPRSAGRHLQGWSSAETGCSSSPGFALPDLDSAPSDRAAGADRFISACRSPLSCGITQVVKTSS